MYLSDDSIIKAVHRREIQVFPCFKERHLRPVGIRVHLGFEILVPIPNRTIDFENPEGIEYASHDLNNGPFVVEPGMFLLASTIESIQTARNLICVLEGRSTMARLGLTIHNTASILDGTDEKPLVPVLEIKNHSNCSILLRGGTPIAMLCFARLDEPKSYANRNCQYVNQRRTTGADIHRSATIDRFDPILSS